jgi:hypothetical protein
MPSASHRWCKRCHKQRIDKRAGLEMCARCKRITLAERSRERRAVKARKALRAQAITLGVAKMPEIPAKEIEAETPSPNGVAHKTSRDYLQDALQRMPESTLLEIGSFYEDRRIKSGDIALEFSISNGLLTQIIDHLGLERRKPGHNQGLVPGRFYSSTDGKRVWKPDEPEKPTVEPSVPEPVEKALERMLKPAPEPPVQRVRPAPVAPMVAPPPQPVLTVGASSTVWEVQVEGLIHVTGEEIQDALDAVKGIYPRLRVRGIRQA